MSRENFKNIQRVFKTAQTRMTLIARTETIRAHNQGQIKFYHTVRAPKQNTPVIATIPVSGKRAVDQRVFERVPVIYRTWRQVR